MWRKLVAKPSFFLLKLLDLKQLKGRLFHLASPKNKLVIKNKKKKLDIKVAFSTLNLFCCFDQNVKETKILKSPIYCDLKTLKQKSSQSSNDIFYLIRYNTTPFVARPNQICEVVVVRCLKS